MKKPSLIDDHMAHAILDAIYNGDEPTSEWLQKLAVWAEHKDERASYFEGELEILLSLKKEAA